MKHIKQDFSLKVCIWPPDPGFRRRPKFNSSRMWQGCDSSADWESDLDDVVILASLRRKFGWRWGGGDEMNDLPIFICMDLNLP